MYVKYLFNLCLSTFFIFVGLRPPVFLPLTLHTFFFLYYILVLYVCLNTFLIVYNTVILRHAGNLRRRKDNLIHSFDGAIIR